MVWAYSSVVEHYVDIVGVASSILATPTIAAFSATYAIRHGQAPAPGTFGALSICFSLPIEAPLEGIIESGGNLPAIVRAPR